MTDAATATETTNAAQPAPTPAPIPVPAQPVPLADRQITEKKTNKLMENLQACMADFDAVLRAAPEKGIATLAGKGALPNVTPEGYKAVSLAVEVIKGRRVSGTLFSSRLKNLLIEQYQPMQLGPWILFNK